MLSATSLNYAPPPNGRRSLARASLAYLPWWKWLAAVTHNRTRLICSTQSFLLIISLALLVFSAQASSHWLEDLLTTATKSKTLVSKAQGAVDDFVRLQQIDEKYLAGRRYLYIDETHLVIDTAGQKHHIPFDTIRQNNFQALVPLFSSSAEVVVPIDNLKYGLIEELAKVLLERNTPIRVIRQDNSLGRVKLNAVAPKAGLTVEIFPALLMDLQAITTNMDWVLYRSFGPEKSRVISIFDKDEVFILPQMDANLGRLHQSTTSLSHADIIGLVEDQKRKAIFLIGHVEDGHIVTRNIEQGITKSIPIAELMAAAKRAKSELILLGCETAAIANSSGYINRVNALDIAGALTESVQQENLGMALSALAVKSGDIFYIPQQVDFASDGQIFIEKVYVQGEKLVKKSAVAGTTLSPALYSLDSQISQELDSRVIPFVPSGIFSWFVFNLIAIPALIFPVLLWLGAGVAQALSDITSFKPTARKFIWFIRSLFFFVFFTPFASSLIMLSILIFFVAPIATIALSPSALIFCIALLWKTDGEPIFPEGGLGAWLKCLAITLVNIPVWVAISYIPGGQGAFFVNDSPSIYVVSLVVSAIYYTAAYWLFSKIVRAQKIEYGKLLSSLLLLPLAVFDRLVIDLLRKFKLLVEPEYKATESPGGDHAEY